MSGAVEAGEKFVTEKIGAMAGSCGMCRFFRPELASLPNGRCHRYPPTLFVFPIGRSPHEWPQYSTWPLVQPSHVCGEYKVKAEMLQ